VTAGFRAADTTVCLCDPSLDIVSDIPSDLVFANALYTDPNLGSFRSGEPGSFEPFVNQQSIVNGAVAHSGTFGPGAAPQTDQAFLTGIDPRDFGRDGGDTRDDEDRDPDQNFEPDNDTRADDLDFESSREVRIGEDGNIRLDS